MRLAEGAERYAERHGKDAEDKKRLHDAYWAGYLQAVDNWAEKAR